MTLDIITKVFISINKELLAYMHQGTFTELMEFKALEFWTALNKLTKDSIYSEFMNK